MTGGEPQERARQAALRLLAQRPRSEREVRVRLAGRFPAALVDQVIASLKEQKLLDDSAFAVWWRERRERQRPGGVAVLRRELASKGVVGPAVEQAVSGVDEEEAAYRAGLKFAARLAEADYAAFHRRLWGHLQRRGFPASVAAPLVRRLWRERRASSSAGSG